MAMTTVLPFVVSIRDFIKVTKKPTILFWNFGDFYLLLNTFDWRKLFWLSKPLLLSTNSWIKKDIYLSVLKYCTLLSRWNTLRLNSNCKEDRLFQYLQLLGKSLVFLRHSIRGFDKEEEYRKNQLIHGDISGERSKDVIWWQTETSLGSGRSNFRLRGPIVL